MHVMSDKWVVVCCTGNGAVIWLKRRKPRKRNCQVNRKSPPNTTSKRAVLSTTLARLSRHIGWAVSCSHVCCRLLINYFVSREEGRVMRYHIISMDAVSLTTTSRLAVTTWHRILISDCTHPITFCWTTFVNTYYYLFRGFYRRLFHIFRSNFAALFLQTQ